MLTGKITDIEQRKTLTQVSQKLLMWVGIVLNTIMGSSVIEDFYKCRKILLKTYIRWIVRRDTIEWPGRSPDLTHLDFYVGLSKII